MKKNKRFLDISYLFLYICLFAIIAIFVGSQVYCLKTDCVFEGNYFGPFYLAICNIIVWIMLGGTTFTFVRMLNKRFGEAEFSGPKCKFFTFLSVFSLSFAIRGTWDLGIYFDPIDIDSKTDYAIILFVLYFITEWIPIFVIYLTHLWAFHSLV